MKIPFLKPTLKQQQEQELKELETNLYNTQNQIDYLESQVAYYKLRIEKIKATQIPTQNRIEHPVQNRIDPKI